MDTVLKRKSGSLEEMASINLTETALSSRDIKLFYVDLTTCKLEVLNAQKCRKTVYCKCTTPDALAILP